MLIIKTGFDETGFFIGFIKNQYENHLTDFPTFVNK